MTRSIDMPGLGFVAAWREAARTLLREGIPPDGVRWRNADTEADLFAAAPSAAIAIQPVASPSVPQSFLPLAEAALCHRSPERFSLPYRLLWRLQQDRNILEDRSDIDVAGLHAMEKSVRRDSHKMKAFVRFRETSQAETGRRRFIAWFEPDHVILERTAPFFARRFADMDWLIVTPGHAARFEAGHLDIRLCDERPTLPDDAADDLWRTYYASIFNPARLKVKAMKSEMPVKYWKNLPEAQLIPELIASAEKSVHAMREAMPTLPHARTDKIIGRLPPARTALPDAIPASLEETRQAATACSRCDLCIHATQTVFGEGKIGSRLLFVGEQPGDLEDLNGRPFTGPAGQVFDQALAEVGLDRRAAYVTNAVKHFKFEPRGKRRIHQRPDTGEVLRCKWWLDLERHFVRPDMIVVLGATAALAVTGRGTDILRRRGGLELADDGLTPVFVTVHPSSVLRSGAPVEQRAARQALVEDFRRLKQALDGLENRSRIVPDRPASL